MTVDISDYSHTAADRGWGAGWPSCTGIQDTGGSATIQTRRSGVRITVHKRIARLALLLLDWTEDPQGGNYRLVPGECGGYNCRSIAGTDVPSNHSWGLAIDLNWLQNPYDSDHVHTMPTAVARMWNRFGFAWGGDYEGSMQDWMHLEFMGTQADADAMTALALQVLNGPDPAILVLLEGEDPVTVIDLAVNKNDGTFRAAVMAECGSSSVVVDQAWLTFGSTFALGGLTAFKVTALGPNGPMKQETFEVPNNARQAWQLPSGCVMATIEGHVGSLSCIPSAALVSRPKTPAT